MKALLEGENVSVVTIYLPSPMPISDMYDRTQ